MRRDGGITGINWMGGIDMERNERIDREGSRLQFAREREVAWKEGRIPQSKAQKKVESLIYATNHGIKLT